MTGSQSHPQIPRTFTTGTLGAETQASNPLGQSSSLISFPPDTQIRRVCENLSPTTLSQALTDNQTLGYPNPNPNGGTTQTMPTNLEPRESKTNNIGVRRLLTFLRVMEICSNAPWSPIKFPENERMIRRLIASHLQLIVGKESWKSDKNMLFSLLDSTENLSNTLNVCWVTNRQVRAPPSH